MLVSKSIPFSIINFVKGDLCSKKLKVGYLIDICVE